MAEVLSKTNLFSSCHHGRRAGFSSAFPKKSCNYKPSSSVRWFQPPKLKSHAVRSSSLSSSDFHGRRLVIHTNRTIPKRFQPSIYAQTSIRFGKAHKWWEKGLQSNMKEVTSAEDLVDSLLNAGDKLVVVEFFSPGCGGCRALHPKICQLAELNPDVQFLQVNYEEHKSMCYSLNVHVLPFFRFYRGSHGRLCSFSCTNATIKKFKDALSKHTPDRCSLGPTKGLEEKELLALSANKDLSFNYTTKPVQPVVIPAQEAIIAETSPSHLNPVPLDLPARPAKSTQDSKEKPLVTAGK